MEARQQWRASARADNGAADPGSTPHSSAHPLPVCVLSPGLISWGGGHGLSYSSCLAAFLHADVGPRRQRQHGLVCVETARGRGDEEIIWLSAPAGGRGGTKQTGPELRPFSLRVLREIPSHPTPDRFLLPFKMSQGETGHRKYS